MKQLNVAHYKIKKTVFVKCLQHNNIQQQSYLKKKKKQKNSVLPIISKQLNALTLNRNPKKNSHMQKKFVRN